MRGNYLTTASVLGLAAALNLSASTVYLSDEIQAGFVHRGVPPCDALAATSLKSRLLFPTDSTYEEQIQTWWAKNARLRPWCLVLPHNSKEVSLALTTILNAGHGAGDWHIALRSGGHSVTGSNNIANGVTIDLSMMNSTQYDKATNTARIGPGGRWENVYASLQDHDVTVVGGRDGDVGVGGFLLGGGLSFFSGRLGFACDSVTNYEVVLANGSVINANKTANPDLWRALKGGSSNFGVVTRYDLAAIPSRRMSYDLRYLAANFSEVVIDTVVDFANHGESFGDDALVTFFTHNTSISQDTMIGTIHVNTIGGTDANTSFSNIEKLPTLFNVTSMPTMAEAAAGSKLPGGGLNAGSTRTFKNDPAILRYCVDLHEEYVTSLKNAIGADHFTTMMFFQPLPSYIGKISQQAGGNMLGLENMKSNAIIWTAGVAVDSDETSLAIAQARLNTMSSQVQQFAASVNGSLDLIYLNYADASQDPLGSYGADQVRYLRDVAVKYDPSGAFQKRVPGGFKISRVG